MKPDTTRAIGISRREFVIGGLTVGALASFGSPLVAAPRRSREPILVVVQLTGGNDGLATVLPIEQDTWFHARPTISRAASGAHRVASGLALHPSLVRSAQLFEEGLLTCVHSVGYPEPDRSHFRSMEIWHTGSTAGRVGGTRPTGWLARLAEQALANGNSSPAALHIGRATLPLALIGDAGPAPSIEDLEQLRVPGTPQMQALTRELYADGARGELEFVRRSARDAVALARRLEDGATLASRAEWPQDEFARSLALVARLIRSDLGARVYQVELDGFDTHRNQPVLHANLLAKLDGALAAFQSELAEAGRAGEVLTLVFSEFGRRVGENASQGTDHGAAGPVFLLGPGARGGFVGEMPDLAQLIDGDLPHRVDFRSIYSAIEQGWMGLDPSSALAPAPILRG